MSLVVMHRRILNGAFLQQLYTPGPGETLTNYEVHLKNRQHRQKVNSRLAGNPPQP